jgi:hypothetical protein
MKRQFLALAALGCLLGGGAAQADYKSTILADSPIAYYRLGESTATVASDSASGLGGLYYGGVTLGVPGAIVGDPDTAATFDGSTGYVRVVSPFSADFTVELWINTTTESLVGQQCYQGTGLIWSDVAGVQDDWIVGYLNNVACFFTGHPDDSITGITTLNDGSWHHIVATRMLGGDKNIYVDGVMENTGSTNANPLTANLGVAIGGNVLDHRYFTGSIDEVAFYTTVLTPEQVLAHYKAGKGQ